MSDAEICAAYDAGYEAALRGGHAADCQYVVGTEVHGRWMLGFEDGGGDERAI